MDHIADKIEVLDSGKIFCAKAQVLVCDISKDMATDHDHESHGMATKLLKMAGPKLTGEMRRYPELCPGQAAIFDSYDYKHYENGVERIVFVCGPRHFHVNRVEAREILKRCYMNALDVAMSCNYHSIVFPTISLGEFHGYRRQEQAIIAIGAVYSWLSKHMGYDMRVKFCLYKSHKWKNRERNIFVHFLKFYREGRYLSGAGNSKGKALVLAGGGAKGAFQVGAWEILEEKGLAEKITGIAGTSVGALNMVLFTTCSDKEKRRDYWCQMPGKVLANPLMDRKQKPLKKILNQSFSYMTTEDTFRKRDLFLATTKIGGNYSPFDRRYYRVDDIEYDKVKKLVLGSAAHMGVYNPVSGMTDGGTVRMLPGDSNRMENCNIPIQPLYDIGYRDFIVVYLRRHIDKYIHGEEERYGDATFFRIYPFESLGDKLSISSEKTSWRIKEGRKAAEKLLMT